MLQSSAIRTVKVSRWTQLGSLITKVKKRKRRGITNLNLGKDVQVGRNAFSRASGSLWWNWDAGSTLFFWRWPRQYWALVHNRTKLFINRQKLPQYHKQQQMPKEKVMVSHIKEKVNGVRAKCYINKGLVRSVTGYFAVPKGEEKIKIVYNATKCGLNDALWTTNFFLPTIDSILRNADEGTWFVDIDLGEMFLNYWLDKVLRPFAGVDVSSLGKKVVGNDGQVVFMYSKKIQRL